tara:strand:- start:405 stop:977 length:573 start_codon:yes stop_codon:yes gene_type:complete
MRRTLRAMLFSLLLISSFGLAGFVTYRLKTFNDQFERIKTADEKVIEQLTKIRIAQKTYFEVKGTYAPTWDTLVLFINQGQLPIIQTTESIITLHNGQDSLSIVIDTLAIVPVYDSLQSELRYTKAQMFQLPVVPLSEEYFDLYTGSRQGEQFIEVKDPNPINPKRQKDGALKPLRFGSKAASTTKGNWE